MKKQGMPAIAFLATLPPPLGGYSVGLKRLVRKLDERGIDYTVYDLIHKKVVRPGGSATVIKNRAIWLLRYFFLGREELVCCHYGDWRALVFVGTMGLLGKRTLLSIGGWKVGLTLEHGWLRRKVIVSALRRYTAVIAHNEDIRQMCLSLGVRADRIGIIPNFIPPTVEADEVAAIPAGIWEFMAGRRPTIAVNAFEMVFYRSQDLYGLDLCVELCARLKARYPDIGFVFSLSRTGDEDYFHKMERRIAELDLGDNFRILKGEYQFYPILMKSQVFLRPTNTDGDANSLREALFFKVPSVASDVCPRPEGTILFKNRDISDLTAKVEELLGNYEAVKKSLESLNIEDNSAKLIDLYRRLMGRT